MKAKFINEFGKGIDPYQTLDIGKYAERRFETVEELGDYILDSLPEIGLTYSKYRKGGL